MAKKLQKGALYRDAWKEAMLTATEVVEKKAIKNAPKQTGALKAGIKHKLDPSPVPLYGIVSTNAMRGGVRYPFVLNSGKGKGGSVLHQRHGGKKSRGKGTRGWFSRALAGNQNRVNRILARAARLIERAWSAR
ncbi:MAG: hypothetical protein Q7J84_03940 [Sulfuricaulis sp.]|nr:hypothetical protein [Sulfuricaulis sp.]